MLNGPIFFPSPFLPIASQKYFPINAVLAMSRTSFTRHQLGESKAIATVFFID